MDSTFRRKLRLLPKAELHLHLEGCLDPALLLELSRRHGHPLGLRDLGAIRRLYDFSDFAGFIQAFKVASQHLITPEDYGALVGEMGRRLAAQGVVYAEVFFSIGILHWKKMEVGPVWTAVESARRQLERDRGVRLAWIFDAVRQFGAPAAERVVDEAILRMSSGPVVAIGIGGDEAAGPAEWFTETYARARAAGLGATAHAGETCGPESMWSALRNLGAKRLGHGLSAARDASLMDHLAANEVFIDVCQISNRKTGCWPLGARHPVAEFDAAGVKYSFGSDDPGFFGSSLLKELYEYSRGRDHLEGARRALRNGFLGSFLPHAEKSAYLRDFDAAWSRLGLDNA